MSRPEAALHEAVVAFLQYALPSDAVLFMIPNEGRRGGRAGMLDGARMKKMGLAAGMPDLCVLHDTFLYCIELKTKKGRVTPVQKEMHARLLRAGAEVEICRDVKAVERFLTGFIPLKARVAV